MSRKEQGIRLPMHLQQHGEATRRRVGIGFGVPETRAYYYANFGLEADVLSDMPKVPLNPADLVTCGV